MTYEPFEVAAPGGPLPARLYQTADAVATLVFAHGAGAGQSHSWICGRAEDLQARGVRVVTFDFPYMASGRRLPDRAPVLVEAYRTVAVQVARQQPGPLLIGGKSMGGRMATMLAAEQAPPGLRGVVAMGYPLHPPGRPDQLRVAHLPRIRVPVLVVQGQRDPFGSPEDVEREARAVGAALQVVPTEGGHGFEVPRRSGNQADVLAGVADEVRAWLDRLLGTPSPPGAA
jgi:predicted alpha/beta-hydrolase family hydrolase